MGTKNTLPMLMITIAALSSPLTYATGSSNSSTPLKNVNYQSPVSILNNETIINVQENLNYDIVVKQTVKINSVMGLQQFSQMPLQYNPELENLDIITAYTLKPDGKKYEVTNDNIREQQSSNSASAPMFNSDKVKIVLFPNTNVGDNLHIEYRKTVKPLFNGNLSLNVSVQPYISVNKQDIWLKLPSSLDMHFSSSGFTKVESVNSEDQKVIHWTLKSYSALNPEPQTANFVKDIPTIFATTFENYKKASEAYLVNHQKKSEVTLEVRELAKRITTGIQDTNKIRKTEALYNWVSTNIRYVAVYFGDGGVNPHYANEIIKNGFGDCKDKVVLLEALLSAEGIDSYPVLININDTYDVPAVAALPGVFNHVITYIPDLDKYVDSTIGLAKFGYLSDSEIGKPVLLTRTGKITSIPITPLSTSHSDIAIQLLENGDAEGFTKSHQTGEYDIISRMTALGIPASMKSRVAKTLLMSEDQQGYGDISFNDPTNLNNSFSVEANFSLKNIFDNKKEGSFELPVGIPSFTGITPSMLKGSTVLEKRTTPFMTPQGNLTSIWTYTIPNTIRITGLPKNVAFKNKIASYKSNYVIDGNQLVVSRFISSNLSAPTSPASSYSDLQAVHNMITKDFSQKVDYKLISQ